MRRRPPMPFPGSTVGRAARTEFSFVDLAMIVRPR